MSFAALLFASASAVAETCPVPEGGSASLAEIDPRARIDFIRATVDDQARYASRWKWAWLGIGSFTFASSVGITIGWAASGGDPSVRQANVVDGLIVNGFAVIPPISTLLLALRVPADARVIDQLLHDTGDGVAGTCLVLARMEELFEKDAAEERLETGWLVHLATVLGVGAFVAIFAVEGATASTPAVSQAHWFNAAFNGGIGLLLTEAQILTTPTGAATKWSRYVAGDLRPTSKPQLSVAPLAVAPGLLFRLTY